MDKILNNLKALVIVTVIYLIGYTINLWKNKKL